MLAISKVDVAIVGGGPAGTVAALAFRQQGASVLLLDANPAAAQRFAGEWIHPPGVAVLRQLGVQGTRGFAPEPGTGFVVYGDDGKPEVHLPYPSGHALTCEHAEMVERLREEAQAAGVDYRPFHRVAEVGQEELVVDDRRGGRELRVQAGMIIGADGRSSVVRKSLGFPSNSTPVSYMASVELRDAELPHEGRGHIVLGGPGPALFYNIGGGKIRGCLDVPLQFEAERRSPSFLIESFGDAIPQQLYPSFVEAVNRGPVRWTVNRFCPRTHFGKGNVRLIGDALGHVPPLSAMGMTLGFQDAIAVAKYPELRDYAQSRESYVPELLANALYCVFMRKDPSARDIRWGLLEMLRKSEVERERTMEILTGENDRKFSFASAFLRAGSFALGEVITRHRRDSSPLELRKNFDLSKQIVELREWLQWPAAAVSNRIVRGQRGKSTWQRPLPALRHVLPMSEETPEATMGGEHTSDERRSSIPPATTGTHPRARSVAPMDESAAADWAWCKKSLKEVSRTFSEPIGVLPTRLEIALTCGYLLCRVADTIEDQSDLPFTTRDALFACLLQVFEERESAATFSKMFSEGGGSGAEYELATNLPRVMRVFRRQTQAAQDSTIRWVGEMTEGMRLYARRAELSRNFVALHSITDLERYCYFVAGTVGELITDLFLEEMSPADREHVAPLLRETCESFGIGLQMVNILKDVTDDHTRGWSYIPEALYKAHGIEVKSALEPRNRAAAHAAVAPLFKRASEHLDTALEYTLAIPTQHRKLRLFCLLPLWMAVRTLNLARGNDKMFIPGKPVKISRTEVMQVITECNTYCGDNRKLRTRYKELWKPDSSDAARRLVAL